MSNDPVVRIRTDLGDLQIRVETRAAPGTARNFLQYVERGAYDGGQFHRTVTSQNQPNDQVKIAVVQADVNAATAAGDLPTIPLERTTQTGLSHRDGTVSMARMTPDSAKASFFICLGDQPELDFGGRRNPDGQGFAAFGQVVQGMDVVRAINEAPEQDQRLTPPITIVEAFIVD